MATSSSAAGGQHQHHASLNLMACVRESSPQQEDLMSDTTDADLVRNGKCSKGVGVKNRYHDSRRLGHDSLPLGE